jgi:hypothetical protein
VLSQVTITLEPFDDTAIPLGGNRKKGDVLSEVKDAVPWLFHKVPLVSIANAVAAPVPGS